MHVSESSDEELEEEGENAAAGGEGIAHPAGGVPG